MPNFVDRLTDQVDQKKSDLLASFSRVAYGQEEALRRLCLANWHPLPPAVAAICQRQAVPRPRPACAVDGSLRRVNLANGATLLVAQALLLGEGGEETRVDVDIRRGNVPRASLERLADLLQQSLEVGLARDGAARLQPGGVLFLDGALYGQLPQLYPLTIEGVLEPLPEDILAAYRQLFDTCRARDVRLLSVAKTSREALLSDLLQRRTGNGHLDVSDSEMIYRWTDGRAGYSTPVLLGKRGFTRGSRELLQSEDLQHAPAIVSFFVRLCDFDDAVRVDLPAFCVGRAERLGDLEDDLLEASAVGEILEILAADYGGLEVYNALLYAADREVRLERSMMHEVYVRLIAQRLGVELRLDRSERRFGGE